MTSPARKDWLEFGVEAVLVTFLVVVLAAGVYGWPVGVPALFAILAEWRIFFSGERGPWLESLSNWARFGLRVEASLPFLIFFGLFANSRAALWLKVPGQIVMLAIGVAMLDRALSEVRWRPIDLLLRTAERRAQQGDLEGARRASTLATRLFPKHEDAWVLRVRLIGTEETGEIE